jgi:hypothetical protein
MFARDREEQHQQKRESRGKSLGEQAVTRVQEIQGLHSGSISTINQSAGETIDLSVFGAGGVRR